MKLTLREAYTLIQAELRQRENEAIQANKPTQWTYWFDCVQAWAGLDHQGREWLYDVVDNKIVNEHVEPDEQFLERVLRETIAEANKSARRWLEHGLDKPGVPFSGEHDQVDMAREWALSVHAEKALRMAGFRLPKRSLDWLRAQQRWPDAYGQMPRIPGAAA